MDFLKHVQALDSIQIPRVYLVSLVGAVVFIFGGLAVAISSGKTKKFADSTVISYCKFFYASFLKPHARTSDGGQQSALESFYETQASVYDATRKRLLRGREDLLGLLAAQLIHRSRKEGNAKNKPVWVDMGGGTGYNIEAMGAFLQVEDFFAHVYLVDLSPSLCEVARKRIERLGWKNVTVICQDARAFRLPEAGADMITMSYSLSMIPDYYSVVDSLTSLLSPSGMVGVCDFYVQSIVDISSRNYTGGAFNRHVNWVGRLFWRAWFDADRVNLDGGRRDFLEYRFGTVLSASGRNYTLGGIPYYIFVGCHREAEDRAGIQEVVAQLDAAFTESPYLSPMNYRQKLLEEAADTTPLRSKAYESAVINLSSNLPLPSAFYQNHHWRIFYNDLLKKHQQFNGEYIYAFNWEDPRADRRLLNIKNNDVILTITSAGDNVLDYMLDGAKRVHAVDLNPNQNHLMELKVAAFTALGYADTWKLFGEGRHEGFREILIQKLSPHMSSQALQYWLNHTNTFTGAHGLYETGGSRHAIKLVRWLFKLLGMTTKVSTMCSVETLNEQKEMWPTVRNVLVCWPLHWAVIGTEWFAWKAFGVPAAQRKLIQDDYAESCNGSKSKAQSGRAMWDYVVNTFDPVVSSTLISNDNYFYYLCLQGKYSKKCHPRYLDAKSHAKFSRPGAFDGLRIHTDEINEVIARISPSTLTVAVLMDSMDWFDPSTNDALNQVVALNRVLKVGGRILFRSAALRPWYTEVFEENGFVSNCVGRRTPITCMDRVNMYASTYLCTKTRDLFDPIPSKHLERLEI